MKMSEWSHNRLTDKDGNVISDSPKLLADLREQQLVESHESEREVVEIDPYTTEGLDELKLYVASQFHEVAEWCTEKGPETLPETAQELYQGIREHHSTLNDLIREQKDLIDSDASELDERGRQLGDRINLLLQMKDLFFETMEQGGGSDPEVNLEETPEQKTGWWNKDFREAQGIPDTVPEGSLTQRGIPEDPNSPIEGPSPEPPKPRGESQTGWWDNDFKRERGIEVPEDELLLDNEVDKDELLLTEEYIEDPEQTAEVINSAMVPASPEVLEGEILPPLQDPRYEMIRREWLDAKSLHEEAHSAYQQSLQEYYAGLQSASFGEKYWNKFKSTFGFKPAVPADIEAQRADMFTATARYNDLARQMVEIRERAGKTIEDQKREAVLNRYHRMLARTTLLNTFNSQLEIQKQATQDLAFGPSEFMKKHGKTARIVGATAIGGLTGGLAGGGFALARVLAGGAVSGATTKFVGGKMDSYVEGVAGDVQEKYEIEVSAIEAMLKRGTLSADELEESYGYLSSIYDKVDKAMQVRIVALLGTAIGTGLLVGGGSGEAMEGLGIGAVPEVTTDEWPRSVSPLTEQLSESDTGSAVEQSRVDAIISGAEGSASSAESVSTDTIAPEVSDAPTSTEGPLAESVKTEVVQESTYSVQKRDNFWNIMEGQTDAKPLPVFEHVSPTEQQHFIKLVELYLNEHPEARTEIGFGQTADMLKEGATVNIAKLNEVAELVAKQNNLYMETLPATPEAVASEPATTESAPQTPTTVNEVASTEVAPPAEGIKASATEASALAKEKIPAPLTASFERVVDYAKTYPGGYLKFEQNFQSGWVEKIQGPTPTSGGLLNFLFSNTNETSDAFKVFDSYTIEEFNELQKIDRESLAVQFKEHHIDINDYDAWRSALDAWKEEGLINYTDKDRFSDVARSAYIATLEKTPNPA